MASTLNADDGVVSGSSGLKSSADATGILALQTNGTTGLTVNASLAIGVGSTPSFGTSGQVLTSAGSSASPTWGAISRSALPTGSIVQVVSATYSTAVTSSTSTYIDTGLTVTITPTSSTNKILVLVSQNGVSKNSNDTTCKIQLLRGASSINVFAFYAGRNSSTQINSVGSASTCYLDSPATTSATTYKTQFASSQNNASATVQESSETSTITLLEVVA